MAKPIEDQNVPVTAAGSSRLAELPRIREPCRCQNLGGSAHVSGGEDEAKTAIAQPQCRERGEQAVFVGTMGASGHDRRAGRRAGPRQRREHPIVGDMGCSIELHVAGHVNAIGRRPDGGQRVARVL